MNETGIIVNGVTYTLEEAKALYDELKGIFGYDKEAIYIPYTYAPDLDFTPTDATITCNTETYASVVE